MNDKNSIKITFNDKVVEIHETGFENDRFTFGVMCDEGSFAFECSENSPYHVISATFDIMEEKGWIKTVGLCWHSEIDPVCSNCDSTKNVTFSPNPYHYEIHDDDTPVWMCEKCRHEAAMDI